MIFSGRDLDVVSIVLVIDIVDGTGSTVLVYNVVSITYCVLALCCLNQCICTLYGKQKHLRYKSIVWPRKAAGGTKRTDIRMLPRFLCKHNTLRMK